MTPDSGEYERYGSTVLRMRLTELWGQYIAAPAKCLKNWTIHCPLLRFGKTPLSEEEEEIWGSRELGALHRK